MMGKVSGVAQIIKQDISHRSLVVHCFCHSFSLACSDTIKNCTLMKNSLDTSFESTKLVNLSPIRESHLKEIIAEDMSTEFVNKTVRSFSKTRWTVRAKSLQSTFTFYKKLKNLWDWCLSEYGEPDIKARVIGTKTQMKRFNFFFGIRLGHLVLSHSYNLSVTLQKPKMSAAEAQKLSRRIVGTIVSLREEAQFNKFWHDTLSEATVLEVDNPKLPRK